jgi:hypothetical protein
MSQIIQVSDEIAAILQDQATARGVTVESWIQILALEKTDAKSPAATTLGAQAAVSRILELQKHVQPDPDGLTVRDYINHGRP